MEDKTYWFYDETTGEEFLVVTHSVQYSKVIANKYFDNPKCLGRVSYYEAETMGLDTYD